MWEFEDNTIYGVAAVEDEVIVFGANNIYTCSVDSRPKILMPTNGNSAFATAVIDPGTIVKRGNSFNARVQDNEGTSTKDLDNFNVSNYSKKRKQRCR